LPPRALFDCFESTWGVISSVLTVSGCMFAAPWNTETNTENLCKRSVLNILQAHVGLLSRRAACISRHRGHYFAPAIGVLCMIAR
jgi:hypothetical protein